jgi:hypothetical protein
VCEGSGGSRGGWRWDFLKDLLVRGQNPCDLACYLVFTCGELLDGASHGNAPNKFSMHSDGLLGVAIAGRCRFVLGASELLPNAGGRVADFVNNTLQSFSGDSEMPHPVFDFDLILAWRFCCGRAAGFLRTASAYNTCRDEADGLSFRFRKQQIRKQQNRRGSLQSNVRLVGSQVVVFAVALSCLAHHRRSVRRSGQGEAVTMSALC